MVAKKRHTNEFKAKMVLVALREDRTRGKDSRCRLHLRRSISKGIGWLYNDERFHESLGYRTPEEVCVEKIGWEKGQNHSPLTQPGTKEMHPKNK